MYKFAKVVLLCVLGGLSYNAAANSLSIRADEWYPINGVPGSEKPGYMIELAQVILEKHGYTLDYKIMPWERSINEVRKGNNDCIVGGTLEDSPDFIFPDIPWGTIETHFYVKKGSSWAYEGIDSLAKVKVGVIGGYAYGNDFDAYVEANKKGKNIQVVKGNNSLEKNIKKVLVGRIDTLVESDLVMNAKLLELGKTAEIVTSGRLGTTANMYISCSPAKAESKKFIQWFTDDLKQMRASGQLQKILDKYGLKDWQ